MDITLKHRESGTSCVVEVSDTATVLDVKADANDRLFSGKVFAEFIRLHTDEGPLTADNDQLIAGLDLEYGTTLFVESSSAVDRHGYLQTIIANPSDPCAYDLLGMAMDNTELISVPGVGSSVSKQQLFQHAICLDGGYHPAYYHLACCTPKGVRVVVDGCRMDSQHLLHDAIRIAPREGAYYRALAETLEKGRITVMRNVSWGKPALLAKAIALDPLDVDAHNLLAESLLPGAKAKMEDENRLATKGDLLYRALLIDPAYAPTYCSLAEGLAGLHSTMDFSDGVMLPDRLYNKLVSTYSTVFSDRIKVLDRSASFLMRTVTVALRGTTTTIAATESDAEDDDEESKGSPAAAVEAPLILTGEELFLKAISLDCRLARAYTTLGSALPWRGKVVLLDRTPMTKQDLLERAVSLEPESSVAYYNLAACMLEHTRKCGGGPSPQASINGREWNAIELLQKCINLDPAAAESYALLGEALREDETAVLFNGGARLGKRDLFLKTLGRDHRHARSYSLLGVLLDYMDAVSLSDGVLVLNKMQLLQRAITLEPHTAEFYTNLADSLLHLDKVVLEQTREELTQQQLYKRAIALDPEDPVPLCRLACTLGPLETTELEDRRIVTSMVLCRRAVELNPLYADAFFSIAKGMRHDDRVELEVSPEDFAVELGARSPSAQDRPLPRVALPFVREGSLHGAGAWGEVTQGEGSAQQQQQELELVQPELPPTVLLEMTRVELLERVMRLDPTHGMVYTEVATLTGGDGKYRMQNGTVLTKAQLYNRAISISPSLPEPYFLLAEQLPPGETAVLESTGACLTKLQLLLKALRRSNRVAKYYLAVGLEMAAGEEVVLPLPDGLSTQEQAFKRVVALAPDTEMAGAACRGLAQCLRLREGVKMLDNSGMVAKGLYVQAISLDPDCVAHNNLGALLGPREQVRLLDRTQVSAHDLFLEAIRLDPSQARPYCNLAEALGAHDTVRLPCGMDAGQRDLIREAIRRDPHDAYFYFVMSSLLGAGETATIPLSADLREAAGHAPAPASGADTAATYSPLNEEELCKVAVFLDPAFDLPYLSLARLCGAGALGGPPSGGETLPSLSTVRTARAAVPKLSLLCGEVSQADLLGPRMARLLEGCGMGPGQDAPFVWGAAGLRTLAVRQHKVDLFVRAVRLHKGKALSYVNLACVVPVGTTVEVGIYKPLTYTRQGLLSKALDLAPSCGPAYYGLALCAGGQGVAMPGSSVVLSKEELLRHAVSADPLLCDAHLLLSRTLACKGIGGERTRMDQVALCTHAIQADTARADAWDALVDVMVAGESVAVGSNMVLCKDVMCESAARCP